MASIQDDAVYKPTEAAELVNLGYQTVLQEIHAGRIHAIRVGAKPVYRIPGWALRNYLAGIAPQPASLVASVGATGN